MNYSDVMFLGFSWICLSAMFMFGYLMEEKIHPKPVNWTDKLIYIVCLPATIILVIYRVLNK